MRVPKFSMDCRWLAGPEFLRKISLMDGHQQKQKVLKKLNNHHLLLHKHLYKHPYVVYKSELFSNFKKRKFLLKITKISAIELQLSENLLWHKIHFENIYNVCCEVECND